MQLLNFVFIKINFKIWESEVYFMFKKLWWKGLKNDFFLKLKKKKEMKLKKRIKKNPFSLCYVIAGKE